MIILEAAQTLRGLAANATSITYTIEGMEYSGGVEVYKVLAQGQLAASVGTLYTVPASTETIIKTISLVNANSNKRAGIQFMIGGTGNVNKITGLFSMPGLSQAVYNENGWSFMTLTGQRRFKAG